MATVSIPYRALDPHREGPGMTGPTRDYAALAAAMPLSVEEPFQIRPARLPIRLQAKIARPETVATPVVSLRPSRVPVLIRRSNVRPSEAGEGLAGSSWGVSDPGLYHRADSGALAASDPTEQPADTAAKQWSLGAQLSARLVLIGIAAGVAAWVMRRNVRQGKSAI